MSPFFQCICRVLTLRTENLCSISPGNRVHAPGSSRPEMLNVLTFLGDISLSFDPDPQTKELSISPEMQVNIDIKLLH